MTELKTLKNLNLEDHEYYDDEVVCVSELRSAIAVTLSSPSHSSFKSAI